MFKACFAAGFKANFAAKAGLLFVVLIVVKNIIPTVRLEKEINTN